MYITMVKKRLASGQPCNKCVQAEALLRKRGVFDRIDRVVWAEETAADSEGMRLAREYGVDGAPFFVVENGAAPRAVTSVLALVREFLAAVPREAGHADEAPSEDLESWIERAARLPEDDPERLVRFALERFGRDCAIAFSGEDATLIEMATRSGLPFSVLVLDTGRLNPETYRFIDEVRRRYKLELDVLFPDPIAVERLVREKGLFSFYQEGHHECCAIRKVAPLTRGLRKYRAWMTGQRRDQSPTRAALATAELDDRYQGSNGPLAKLNPLAAWTADRISAFGRAGNLPVNELVRQGYRSIGCEPCTRPVLAGEHERTGRWWWEAATARECGLHVASVPGGPTRR